MNNSSFKPTAFLFDLGDIFFEAHYWRKWLYNKFVKIINYQKSFTEFYNSYEVKIKDTYQAKQTYDVQFERFINNHNIPNAQAFIKEAFIKKKEYEDLRTLYPEVYETLLSLKEKNKKIVVLSDNELVPTAVF